AQTANIGVTLACVLTNVCSNDAAAAAIQIGGAAVFAKFSRDDESQADDEAIKNVVRAGINPKGIPDMFQILLNERNSSDGGGVSSWFATHPLEENRIAATQEKIAQINPAILATLTEDSPNYQAFKRRVQSLPPSPRPRSTGR
ncbi:MAG TPA: M48 family metalloprotease, partial [Gemmatimonadaceae bacterium]|nr:M48 family metalloprotease [Gemmatimonadaceae bacterium]